MKRFFCCIGATNLDICGKADYELQKGDSTLGSVNETVGGVGHNIITNLSRLVDNCKFITTIGNDSFATIIEKDLDDNKNLEVIKNKVDHASGIYLYIKNSHGEMIHAINEMGINQLLTPQLLSQHSSLIKSAPFIIIDTNIPQESIEYICQLNSNIIVDPVSCKKSEKLINILDKIMILKPNEIELESLSGIKISTDEDIITASNIMLEKGVKCVITTRGAKGAVYHSHFNTLFVENPPIKEIVNTTGAGDAFTAGVCYALFNNYSPLDIIKNAICCSQITLQSEKPISDKLTKDTVKEVVNESVFRYRT